MDYQSEEQYNASMEEMEQQDFEAQYLDGLGAEAEAVANNYRSNDSMKDTHKLAELLKEPERSNPDCPCNCHIQAKLYNYDNPESMVCHRCAFLWHDPVVRDHVDQALTAQREAIYKELAEETIDVDVNWDSFSFTSDLQRSEALHLARSVWTKGVNQVMSKYSTPQQKESN